MDRKLWKNSYGSIPHLPCPRCKNGKLKTLAQSMQRKEPFHFRLKQSADDLHDVSEGRFALFLVCSAGFCGELVAVSGDYASREISQYDDTIEDHVVFEDLALYVRAMMPAPPLIAFPARLGLKSKAHLLQAFELFWINRGACANRLRICVETLLDDFEVARKGIRTSGKHGTLDLSERIDLFEATRPGHKPAFDALRYVGNTGSHEGDAALSDLLVCFEALEFTLFELIEQRQAKLMGEIEAIIGRKGRPLQAK